MLFNFDTLFDYLIKFHGFTSSAACDAAHKLYKCDQINRYSYEEYLKVFSSSSFNQKQIVAICAKPFHEIYSDDKLNTVKKLYPGMVTSASGFEILFKKKLV